MKTVRRDVTLLFGVILFLWLVLITGNLFGLFSSCGVHPRNVSLGSALGLLCAPLVHGGPLHLLANTISFAILGFLVLRYGLSTFLQVTLWGAIIGGIFVWMMGRSTIHIGASGVIFAYFGFIMASAYFRRSMVSILLATVVFIFYGGMVFGVLPGTPGVSWESHLAGLVSGILLARLYREKSMLATA